MLVDILCQLVTPYVLQALVDRLMVIKEICRYPNFQILVNAKKGYFLSQANYVGFEHQAIMQIIIFCSLGLYEDGIVHTITLVVQWYIKACQSSYHLEGTLQEIKLLMRRYEILFCCF